MVTSFVCQDYTNQYQQRYILVVGSIQDSINTCLLIILINEKSKKILYLPYSGIAKPEANC